MGVAVDRIESRAFDAAVAELVDAPGLGPGAARREGSSPFGRTSLVTCCFDLQPARCLFPETFHDKCD